MLKKVYIYFRVSTKKQEYNGIGLDVQENFNTDNAVKFGFNKSTHIIIHEKESRFEEGYLNNKL